MKQITAVEWLIYNMENIPYNPLEKNGYIHARETIIEQAKKMEKEQIIDAFDEGTPNGFIDNDGEQYYKENYEK